MSRIDEVMMVLDAKHRKYGNAYTGPVLHCTRGTKIFLLSIMEYFLYSTAVNLNHISSVL